MPRPTARQIFERLIPLPVDVVQEREARTRRSEPQVFRTTTSYTTSIIHMHHMVAPSTTLGTFYGTSYAIG